jgi:hypothetical protein
MTAHGRQVPWVGGLESLPAYKRVTALVSRTQKIWCGRPLIHSTRIQTIKRLHLLSHPRGRGGIKYLQVLGHGPHGASRGDFFSGYEIFGPRTQAPSRKVESFQGPPTSTRMRIRYLFSRHSMDRGAGQKSGRFRSGTGGPATRTFSQVSERFFSVPEFGLIQ